MPRVLVIDDESLILDFLSDILIRLGYEVKIVHDGKEGIDVFNTDHELDLVITDIRMPRMDGNAVAGYIRNSDRPDMPIIAISGFADEAESELFNFLIKKPFQIQTLADVIKNIRQIRS